MRAIWKGTLSFGLVSVPVRLVVAQDRQPLRFRRVARRSGAPVRHRRWDPVEGRELTHGETVRALDLGGGRLAAIEPRELDALRAGAAPRRPDAVDARRAAPRAADEDEEAGAGPSEDGAHEAEPEDPPKAAAVDRPAPEPQTIAVEGFVPLPDVPPELYDRAYWLAPEPAGRRPYRLLLAALAEAGQAAICRLVLREREHLALVAAGEGLMVLHTLHWPEDVRRADRERIAATVAETPLEEPELALARRLVTFMERPFAAEEHRDATRARVLAYLAARADVAPPAAPAPEEASAAPDLIAALRASLAVAEGRAADADRASG